MQKFGFNRGMNTALCRKCDREIDLDDPNNADIDLDNPLCTQCMADKGGGNDPETENLKTEYEVQDKRHERKGG